MWGIFKRSSGAASRCPTDEEAKLTQELEQSRERAKKARGDLLASQIDMKTAVIELLLDDVVQGRKR